MSTTTTTTTTTLRDVLRVCERLDWADASRHVVDNAVFCVRALDNPRPGEITTARLDLWVASMRGDGRSGSRIRALLSSLRVMLHRAQRLGLIDTLPLFPEPRTLPMAEPRALVLQPDWVDALTVALEGESQQAAQLVRLLLNTGLRVSEALSLHWDHVDLQQQQQLLITRTKAHKARRIPINAAALEVLQQRRLVRTTGPVFSLKLRRLQQLHRAAVDRVCQQLVLGEEVRAGWVLHTLRHTCLTRLASIGWSAPQLQQFAGHSSLAVTQRYVHGSAVALPQLPTIV